MTDPIPNVPLLEKVYDHIVAHPAEWRQQSYVATRYFLPEDEPQVDAYFEKHDIAAEGPRICSTAFCVAGHAAFMTGAVPVWSELGEEFSTALMRTPDGDIVPVDEYAQLVLGLTNHEAGNLFYGGNSLNQVRLAIDEIKARADV